VAQVLLLVEQAVLAAEGADTLAAQAQQVILLQLLHHRATMVALVIILLVPVQEAVVAVAHLRLVELTPLQMAVLVRHLLYLALL
jgi:hypothetical protein